MRLLPLGKAETMILMLTVKHSSSVSEDAFLQLLSARIVAFPMTLLAFSSNKLTCFWPKPSAFQLSDSAWTVATASTSLKTSEIQGLAASFF